jgi:hypothetical protein
MCEGIKEATFQGGVRKPYVDTFRMQRNARQYHWDRGGKAIAPYYRQPIPYLKETRGDIARVRVYVEDLDGRRIVYAADGVLCLDITWTWQETHPALYDDGLEGTYVIQCDRCPGVWDMG